MVDACTHCRCLNELGKYHLSCRKMSCSPCSEVIFFIISRSISIVVISIFIISITPSFLILSSCSFSFSASSFYSCSYYFCNLIVVIITVSCSPASPSPHHKCLFKDFVCVFQGYILEPVPGSCCGRCVASACSILRPDGQLVTLQVIC